MHPLDADEDPNKVGLSEDEPPNDDEDSRLRVADAESELIEATISIDDLFVPVVDRSIGDKPRPALGQRVEHYVAGRNRHRKLLEVLYGQAYRFCEQLVGERQFRHLLEQRDALRAPKALGHLVPLERQAIAPVLLARVLDLQLRVRSDGGGVSATPGASPAWVRC